MGDFIYEIGKSFGGKTYYRSELFYSTDEALEDGVKMLDKGEFLHLYQLDLDPNNVISAWIKIGSKLERFWRDE